MNGGGGGGMHRLDQREHSPLYEKDTNETKNRPMETTTTDCLNNVALFCEHDNKFVFKLFTQHLVNEPGLSSQYLVCKPPYCKIENKGG